jgi:glycosyltransferase involved in cell wall biosynthesis
MMKGWTRFAFNKADGFITQSSQVEEELLKLCPGAEKLWRRRCPHPMYDFQEFSAPPKDIAKERLKVNESKVLLFFGIVRKYKGLMTLIEAFPEIHRYFKGDVRLLIAGEFYESLTEYVRAIEQTGCADKITLHNRFIPNESVGDYFQAADVVVLPYLTASQSGVTQMAYGFGKPVIASAVGGLPETVEEGETGLLFSLGDSASLAQKVKEFYEKYLNTDWVKNIADLKERFSWTGMVEAIIDFTDEFKVQPPNPFTNYP